ncbi:hypothetical protein CLHOM_12340 [Clostridium homopropionicum DSM 5847]|uniref:Uncharacterized protein n=2 Tax=Clostridium TaxID=1485 RepID=A0A0L6ZBI4_9CLOT|nr:hypothetical protein CLHOM_12340 [Clostridium homopropionicum DSM 5847]SFG93660.1 hypothetical protein SAMN04488501_1257 [Clostridium homopropionicum]
MNIYIIDIIKYNDRMGDLKMKKTLLILLTLLLFMISGCSSTVDNNKYVSMVKNGHPTDYPNSTYGTSFEKFFGSPNWKYFKSDDGKDVVEFTGSCTYQDVQVKARMQFILDVTSGTFQAGALSFNDVPQNQLITAALLSKVFENSSTEASSKSEEKNSSTNKSSESTQETFYGQWIISKLINNDGIGTYSSDDINNIIGKQLSFSSEKSSSFGDDISIMKNIVNNPTYQKLVISKDDFVTGYRISFDKLGIKKDSVTEINVLDSNNTIQCSFYILDKDTLILYGGGAFFELKKK